MGHINFLTLTYTSLAILIGLIFISDRVSFLFESKYKFYFAWLYLLTIGEFITLAIFIMYYQEIANKRGKRGKMGKRGERGMTGNNADCKILSGSLSYPSVKNCIALDALIGVFNIPSLCGFSPMVSIIFFFLRVLFDQN